MASKKLSSDTSLANSYKLSRGVASVARPSAPTIGTATDGGSGNMSVTFTASTLGPTASSFTLTSSSGGTGSGASSPLTLQELAIGTYTYSVYGTNANGNGPSSAASNSVVVASVYSNSYESISTVTVGSGGAATITFSSIPQTYKHLQIRASAKSSGPTNGENTYLYFNNTSASTNYAIHVMRANFSTATAYSATSSRLFANVGTPNATNNFGIYLIDILDYTNTTNNKTLKSFYGYSQNVAQTTSTGVTAYSDLTYINTSAITQIDIDLNYNFSQYSTFSLYGIKG